ncbi:armadillo-type protein [Cubamyces menziesii]|nr:armadillo-type protein [Cubamyces menziesii]
MASTTTSSPVDVLAHLFLGLRNKRPDVQAQASLEMQRYIFNTLPELPSDSAAKLWDQIINEIFDLVHSQTTADKLGGILVIDSLLRLQREIDSKANLFRFYTYVKTLLPDLDVNVMLAASKTLGQIAKIGGPVFGGYFMDCEVQSAMALLQAVKQESERHAGVLILKELARNSPTHFHTHVDLIFDKILVPLRDTRVIVRESTAELLAACLEIITQRERQARSPYLLKILQDAQTGLKIHHPESIHGSLLAYRELLLHGGTVRTASCCVQHRLFSHTGYRSS